MSTLRRAIVVLGLVAQALVPAAASGQEGFASTGGTTVSVDAPFVTITVAIDIVVSDPSMEGVGEWAADMANRIMAYWNDGLAKVSNCPYYDLVVTINPVSKSAVREIPVPGGTTLVTVPGHHVVAWEGSGPNAPWPETYDAYDEDHTANPGEDYTTPFTHELWAVWSGHLDSDRNLAHEFGHLLGFADDMRPGGLLPIGGRQGTLMDGGDGIDADLANRLADIARKFGQQMPECWAGTMDFTLSKDYLAEPLGLPPEVCSGSWRVTPSFTVNADGTISGSATAVLTSGPECTFEIPGTGTTAEFNVSGTASSSVLELQFTQTGIERPGDWMGFPGAMTTTYQVERVSPTHAEATTSVSTTDAGPFPVMGSVSIALDCSTCSTGP